MKNHATPFIPSEQAQASLNRIPPSFHSRVTAFAYRLFHDYDRDYIDPIIEEVAELIEESLNEFLAGPATVN